MNPLNQEKMLEYDDSYPTCAETFATLRIFSDDFAPEEITATLDIQPTSTFRKGESHGGGRFQRKVNGWFYTTQQITNSRDFRRHLDLILDRLSGRSGAVKTLQAKGCQMDIMSFYVSFGQGGPWLMPRQMRALGALDLSIWWDIYFRREDEEKFNNEDQSSEPQLNSQIPSESLPVSSRSRASSEG
jgi:hypothetical protein